MQKVRTHLTSVVLPIVLLILNSTAVLGTVPMSEREALIAFFEGTDGHNWNQATNWQKSPGVFNDAGTECTWFGVQCDAGETTVVAIQMESNALFGPIPIELENLTNLVVLNLLENALSGPIPSELANLANLEVLVLLGNRLSGSIPAHLGDFDSLVELRLDGNRFEGPIPSELGNLENLRILFLGDSPLNGSIPPSLGDLSNLEQLVITDTEISGSIPPELSGLTSLRELFLSFNELEGAIPPELGELENLVLLVLRSNHLTGPIPSELGNLSNLQRLELGQNQLEGPLPADLGMMSSLNSFNAAQNRLEGPLPTELGDLGTLFILNLAANQIDGSIPPEFENLSNLGTLDLSNNQLENEIPPELGNLGNLRNLDLSQNELTGAIPAKLGELANLERLELCSNHLEGPIPPELGDLPNLTDLHLQDNQLSGPIPPELGMLTALQALQLSDNQLIGPIPLELTDLPELQDLLLARNQLNGTIPPELGEFDFLYNLDLSENQLTGPIPPELGMLVDLNYLNLAENELEGPVPDEFANFVDLDDGTGLDLRSNHLYTDNNSLRDFLNSKQADGGDWESFQTLHRYFAQFGDGGGLFSQLILFSLNDVAEATGQIEILGAGGEGLEVDLNGTPVMNGVQDLAVPPSGLVSLRTDAEGDVAQGSVRVTTDRHVEGVVIFGGGFGLAGVGSSPDFPTGFAAPMQSNTTQGIDTGVALTILSSETTPAGADISLKLTLLDAAGQMLAEADSTLPANGHDAFFVSEIEWNPPVDFSDFTGTLVVTSVQSVTATAIQTRPGEFVTLPVAPFQAPEEEAPAGEPPVEEYPLYFAQFADGAGALASEILLLNLSAQQSATVQLSLRDNDGGPLTVDLNTSEVVGQTMLEIAPGALQALATDGLGEVQEGSVTVTSDQPLAGVIIFSGNGVGAAGVGSSQELPEGLLAPMETNQEQSINTGIALMNLEETDQTIQAQLLSSAGQLLASAQIMLPALGHDALFVTEFAWDVEVDFVAFQGLLRLQSEGRTAATVIQTRPAQFATMPVASKPAN